jgi:hypothetical protein
MADPILHEAEIRPGIQEVRGDRMFEHVEMPLRGREAGRLTVVFHQRIELPAGNRRAALGEKEAWRGMLALAEVGLERGDLIRAEGIDRTSGGI